MQPTTNTPFERFAFTVVWCLTLAVVALPFLLLGFVSLFTFNAVPVLAMVSANYIFSIICTLGIPVFCIICAIKIERDHIQALAKAEIELSDIIISDMKTLPQNWKPVATNFVSGNVVIANDYLKAFLWTFRNLIGGESLSFSKLLSRARREATVRVLRKARECGANVVWNIRYETSVIQMSGTAKSMAGVEVLAYATAFTVEKQQG